MKEFKTPLEAVEYSAESDEVTSTKSEYPEKVFSALTDSPDFSKCDYTELNNEIVIWGQYKKESFMIQVNYSAPKY
jgi:hypothetical protein